MQRILLGILLAASACGGASGGDDVSPDAPAASPTWPTGAVLQETGTHFQVAFDDRGRQLLNQALPDGVREEWRYQGDFLAEYTRSLSGTTQLHYLATFAGDRPQTATDLDGTTYTWDWNTAVSPADLRTMTRSLAGNTTTMTYERTPDGYAIDTCAAARCSRTRFVGPVDYLGGPERWTRAFLAGASNPTVGERSYDANGFLLERRTYFPPDPEQSTGETWTRKPDGPPTLYVYLNGGGSQSTIAYTFD